MPPEKQ